VKKVLSVSLIMASGFAILSLGLLFFISQDNKITVGSLPESTSVPTKAVLPFVATTTATPEPLPTATPTPQPSATPQPEPTMTTMPEPTLAPPSPTPRPIVSIVPSRIRIPAIGIDTDVEQVGKTRDGAMDVPQSFWTVGWYKLGFKPGEPGSAVMAGHVDNPKGPAIFWDLRKLQPGNKVLVSDRTGKELVFEVFEAENYPFDNAPLSRIFGNTDDVYLNLITCTGVFDRSSQNYDKRLVVYTRLISVS
jgi:sortase (surface protein transpeptidase)